jgi:glycine C-acetyltransferase
MPTSRLGEVLGKRLDALSRENRLKGNESVICGVIPARDGKGPRYLLEGEGDKPFLRMNSNSYLGMSFHTAVIAAEEKAARAFGTWPGAVRFTAAPGRRTSGWSGASPLSMAAMPLCCSVRPTRP